MNRIKCDVTDVDYKIRYKPVNTGFFLGSKVVFKWQVVKQYTQYYDEFCEFSNFQDTVGDMVESVVAEFGEDDEQSAKDLLAKYKKSMEIF
jgi:hypothetical protein